MCNIVNQIMKADELRLRFNANLPEHLPEDTETKFYSARGFNHPELLIVLERKGQRIVDLYKWGLMATWNKPLTEMLKIAKGTLNARSEDVRVRSSYRQAIKNQRCVIPVNGFFEYKEVGEGKDLDKLPFYIHPKQQPHFNLAGLYSFYKDPATQEWHRTFTIVTEPANVFMAEIHNSAKRMPLMLSDDLVDDWINPETPPGMVDEILQFACDDSTMAAYRVDRQLIKIGNDPKALEKIEV